MKRSYFASALMLALCTTLFGCNSNSDNNELPVIDIAAAFDNPQEIKLGEYASAIEYVPLETTEKSLVNGSIISLQMVATDKGVVIYGTNSTSTPIHFGNDGKFISLIGSNGRSVTEYDNIQTIVCHQNLTDIIEYNRIVSYDNNTGEYAKSTEPSDSRQFGRDLHRFQDGSIVYIKNDWATRDDILTALDSDGNEVASKLINKIEYEQVQKPNVILEEGVFFAAPIKNQPMMRSGLTDAVLLINEKDTVYFVDKEANITPKYLVSYGKYTPGCYWNYFYFETEKFITSRALFKANLYTNIDPNYRFTYFIYDKDNGTTRGFKYDPFYKTAGFTNDLDNGGIPFYPVAIGNGKMYQLVSAIKFMDYAEQSSSQKMKDVAATITEESNPVMIVVTLK